MSAKAHYSLIGTVLQVADIKALSPLDQADAVNEIRCDSWQAAGAAAMLQPLKRCPTAATGFLAQPAPYVCRSLAPEAVHHAGHAELSLPNSSRPASVRVHRAACRGEACCSCANPSLLSPMLAGCWPR